MDIPEQFCTVNTQRCRVFNSSGGTRCGARVVTHMPGANRINIHNAKSFAQFRCTGEPIIDRIAVQQPPDVDGRVTQNGTLNAGRIAKVGGFLAEGERHDFWGN